MEFDLDKLRGMNSQDNDTDDEGGGLTDMVKDMMKSIFGDDPPKDLGSLMNGIDPGDLTNFMLDVENGLGGMFGGSETEADYEEVDFEELLANYSPACKTEKDARLKDYLKSWLKSALPTIDEENISMLGIELDEGLDFEEGIVLAYNDDDRVWDIKAWLDSKADTFDSDLFDDWYFNEDGSVTILNENGEEDIDMIYDIITLAVKELYDEGFIESCFGKKLPFVISSGKNDYMTAVRSVKCCARELFNDSFFESCDLYDDDSADENEPEE